MAEDPPRRKGRKRQPPSKTPPRGSKAPKSKRPRTKTPAAPDAADSFVEPAILAEIRAVEHLLDRDGAVSEDARQTPPLDQACQRLLELVRERCPQLLPRDPLKPGTVAAPVPVQSREAAALVRLAAQQAVVDAAGARMPADSERLPLVVLWQDGPDALLVEVGRIEIRTGDGVVSVFIPVRCDQLTRGRAMVQVDLVFGTADRPAGLLGAATDPHAPRIVVNRWGEALTALAWQAVLDSVGGVAAAVGVDRDGAVLVPTALTVSSDGLAVLAQARHESDRIRPGRVVAPPQRGTAAP
jgi:hypothetical protein